MLRTLPMLVLTTGLGLLAISPPAAQAEPDCLTGGPAATLLFPFFEVDLEHPFALSSLISINNEINAPHVARVVFWTDWGVPTLAFDLYLKAFDVQTMNLRDVFNGNLPATGGGEDLTGFPNCALSSFSPDYPSPALAPLQLSQIRAAHTGVLGPGNPNCLGEPHGDNVARGYVTVDVVSDCSGLEAGNPVVTPANAGLPYFGSVAIDANVLWGDWFLVDPGNAFAQGNPAVQIWADAARFDGADTHSFYGRYHNWDGRDHRVPLSQVWATRYADGGAFNGGTNFLVWRDTKSANISGAACGGHPAWFPLVADYISTRDEDANTGLQLQDSTVFPLATQRVNIRVLDPPTNFGRIQLGLAHTTLSNPAQAWVTTTMDALGQFSVSFDATPVIDACGTDPTP